MAPDIHAKLFMLSVIVGDGRSDCGSDEVCARSAYETFQRVTKQSNTLNFTTKSKSF